MVVLRSLGGLLSGIITTVVVMLICETLLSGLYPLPAGLNPADPQAAASLAEHIAKAPVWVGLLLVLGHALATFAGAATAAALAARGKLWYALAIGLLFLAGGIANVRMIPHPAWLVMLWLPAYPLSALLAGWLIEKLQTRARLAGWTIRVPV